MTGQRLLLCVALTTLCLVVSGKSVLDPHLNLKLLKPAEKPNPPTQDVRLHLNVKEDNEMTSEDVELNYMQNYVRLETPGSQGTLASVFIHDYNNGQTLYKIGGRCFLMTEYEGLPPTLKDWEHVKDAEVDGVADAGTSAESPELVFTQLSFGANRTTLSPVMQRECAGAVGIVRPDVREREEELQEALEELEEEMAQEEQELMGEEGETEEEGEEEGEMEGGDDGEMAEGGDDGEMEEGGDDGEIDEGGDDGETEEFEENLEVEEEQDGEMREEEEEELPMGEDGETEEEWDGQMEEEGEEEGQMENGEDLDGETEQGDEEAQMEEEGQEGETEQGELDGEDELPDDTMTDDEDGQMEGEMEGEMEPAVGEEDETEDSELESESSDEGFEVLRGEIFQPEPLDEEGSDAARQKRDVRITVTVRFRIGRWRIRIRASATFG